MDDWSDLAAYISDSRRGSFESDSRRSSFDNSSGKWCAELILSFKCLLYTQLDSQLVMFDVMLYN